MSDHFIREIPIFAKYEVRVSILTWDAKWAFMVGRFVTRPKPGSKARKAYGAQTIHRTPVSPGELADSSGLPLEQSISGKDPIEVLKLLTRHDEDPDGAIVHCIALSEVCYKIGRITIPPALVFSSDGMATPPPPSAEGVKAEPYSVHNPPPHWDHVRKLRLEKEKFVKLLTGGWREAPEGERWWEDAFKGQGEARRIANLKALDAIRRGMDAARTM